MNIGTKLRQIREQHGYSQKNVADMLETRQSTYCSWENSKPLPKLKILPKLAEIYKVDLAELAKRLFDENISFKSNNQQGGVANVLINNASEQIDKEQQARISHLEEEILFLRKMLESK